MAFDKTKVMLASVPDAVNCPWVSVQPCGVAVGGCSTVMPCWRLVDFVFQDEEQSGGRHNIYITVLDESGAPKSGIQAHQAWPDGDTSQATLGGVTDFGVYGGPFYPDRGEVGPYQVYIEARNKSDVVAGMGLPANRHVSYLLTFRWTTAAPAPAPAPAGDYVERSEFPEIVRTSLLELLNV
jgi:hypothetical protein